jgi:hypothetical protein
MTAQGRALLLGRRRRWAGMLHIAVDPRPAQWWAAWSPAPETQFARDRTVATLRYRVGY